MPRIRPIFVASSLLLILAVLGPLAGARERGSEIVYPPQNIPLRFSHATHLKLAGVTCEQCHERIGKSASSLDNNMPGEAACLPCHKIERSQFEKSGPGPSARCVSCHPSFVANSGSVRRVQLPIPNLKFSHKKHVTALAVPCERCHGDIASVGQANASDLPSMRNCQGCHDGKSASGRCTTCHLARGGRRMQTEFSGLGKLLPSGSLRGAAHDMEFRTSHKYAAQNDASFCASCHQQDECTECHNGIRKPMDFHVGDYVRMHAIEARRNSPDCSGCHRVQTFCQACHSRMGVADDERGGQFRGTGNYHPPGWNAMGLAGRGVNHHAFEAQRNIRQCASCHRESFCTTCHSAEQGTPQINPHPRGWLGSRRCRALVRRNKRMCLRCHSQGSQGATFLDRNCGG